MKPLGVFRLSVILGASLLVGCHAKVENALAVERSTSATNQYHGVAVVDAFQWLESGTNPAVKEWSAAQNQQARGFLDKLPTRPWIKDRLAQLLTNTSPDYYSLSYRQELLFLLKFQPPAQQPILVTLRSFTNLTSERVVLDPNRAGTNGALAIDWYVPSQDGKRVAVSLSAHGSEEGTLHIYESADGRALADVIPRVQAPTAGGSVAWNQDGTGLFYTRYPQPGERPESDLSFYQQVYYHRLGTSVAEDSYEFGKDLPRIAEIELKSSPDGRRILASVANGDGGEFAHYLREPDGLWRQIARFEDQVKQVEFGRDPLYIEWGADHALYLLSRRGAPRGKVLRLPLDRLALTNAATIVPEGKQVIADIKPAASGLCLVYLNGGPSEFGYLDYFDNTVRRVDEHTPTRVGQVLVMQGDDILFRVETYTEPFEWLFYSPTRLRDRLQSTLLVGKSPVSFGDVEVVREMVKSKDATPVPLNIIRKRGTRLNGENPVILSGYGGYSLSQVPQFDVARRVWLDQGGIFAIANLRGGGEFGETWHRAGALTNKQNVFDDFIACAEMLVRSNYTSAAKLAIRGGSNGGLLMGAALTQRPELFRAVVAHVGLYDMLRAERDPNGTFNVTEFGTVTDPDQFKALYAYSPYHHVVAQTPYPSVLMLTGENDGRVNPAHSRKMVAALQGATASKNPILLRTSSSGHGLGTALDERIEQLADVYSFAFDQLGVDYSLIDRGPWSGAITPASVLIKAKLVREGLTAQLNLSQSPSFSERTSVGAAKSVAADGNIVAFDFGNLQPNTQYYYALEVAGQLDRKRAGQFRTLPPPGPASFSIVFSGDARTGSASDVFDRIREHHPLLFMNLGDLHYLDIQSTNRARFREGYDAVLASPQQAELYRQVPFLYVWDDHDFAGNNSNRKAPGRVAAQSVYREYLPHYPLPLNSADREGPVCQSFAIGRVKFIVTDLRSERDDAKKKDDFAKTMMGPKQKAWFKNELLAANGKYPLICWASSVPWIGKAGLNVYHNVKSNQFGYIHHSQLAPPPARTNLTLATIPDDWWSVFSTERRELADFIKANRIRGLCILHADSHMLAADDGSNSDYATGGGAPIPVMCAAPLDKEPSMKGGPYSQGIYRVRPGEGCFGLLTITDQGERIDVSYSGRNNLDEEKVALKFSVLSADPRGGAR